MPRVRALNGRADHKCPPPWPPRRAGPARGIGTPDAQTPPTHGWLTSPRAGAAHHATCLIAQYISCRTLVQHQLGLCMYITLYTTCMRTFEAVTSRSVRNIVTVTRGPLVRHRDILLAQNRGLYLARN